MASSSNEDSRWTDEALLWWSSGEQRALELKLVLPTPKTSPEAAAENRGIKRVEPATRTTDKPSKKSKVINTPKPKPNIETDSQERGGGQTSKKAKGAGNPKPKDEINDQIGSEEPGAQDTLAGITKRSCQKTNEERLRRFRYKPSAAYLKLLSRVKSRSYSILSRKRSLTSDEKHEEEAFVLSNTSKRNYQVVITKQPTCDCPAGAKSDLCEHIVHVMVNVLNARECLCYQAALLSTELNEIFTNAPPTLHSEQLLVSNENTSDPDSDVGLKGSTKIFVNTSSTLETEEASTLTEKGEGVLNEQGGDEPNRDLRAITLEPIDEKLMRYIQAWIERRNAILELGFPRAREGPPPDGSTRRGYFYFSLNGGVYDLEGDYLCCSVKNPPRHPEIPANSKWDGNIWMFPEGGCYSVDADYLYEY